MRALALVLVWILVSGSSCQQGTVREVEVHESVSRVYVPIRPELVKPHPIAKGSVAEWPQVCAAREAELVKCNADKALIENEQGTPAEE